MATPFRGIALCLALPILQLTVAGCSSNKTLGLTNDPQLLEQLLDETTRQPASITFTDDSVYSTDAYSVTVRDDTLEWLEHDSIWSGAGLNDVESVTLNRSSRVEGLFEGMLLGPIAGAALGVVAVVSPADSDAPPPAVTPSELATAALAGAAIGEVVGLIAGVASPPNHSTVYRVEPRRAVASIKDTTQRTELPTPGDTVR